MFHDITVGIGWPVLFAVVGGVVEVVPVPAGPVAIERITLGQRIISRCESIDESPVNGLVNSLVGSGMS